MTWLLVGLLGICVGAIATALIILWIFTDGFKNWSLW